MAPHQEEVATRVLATFDHVVRDPTGTAPGPSIDEKPSTMPLSCHFCSIVEAVSEVICTSQAVSALVTRRE